MALSSSSKGYQGSKQDVYISGKENKTHEYHEKIDELSS